MKKRVGLIILDGWGHGDKTKSDAIHHANTPFVDSLYENSANAELRTDGEHVGLPEGQMGNSEVGHLNIGAGRVVYQDLVRINRACEDGSLAQNEVLAGAIDYSKKYNKKVRILGLVSEGGVHSSIDHLLALCDILNNAEVNRVLIHAFTDGRDTDPKSAIGYLNRVNEHISDTDYKIATIVGRYYAMDRDQRWERIKLAYDLMVHGQGEKFNSLEEGINASYDAGVTDEFIKPIVLESKNATIEPGDVVICFNFRTDRCRQITRTLTQETFAEYDMIPIPLHYITMTRYAKMFEGVKVLFQKEYVKNTLGEVITNEGLKQIRIAETEKYPHVTFFFSGNQEAEFDGEKRIMLNSPKVATYDLQPEMSAHDVTSSIVVEINQQSADFICLNFANTDMVGHTGVYEAIISAAETVDGCLKQVVEAGQAQGYSFIVIADHGNSDFAINEDGSPNTAHTTNPVPVFVIDNDIKEVKSGILADVAPTVLKILGVDQPAEMTGNSLV